MLHRKTALGLIYLRTLVLEQQDMNICLLMFHSFFHSTNNYKVFPKNKAHKKIQGGIHKNPNSKGVLSTVKTWSGEKDHVFSKIKI